MRLGGCLGSGFWLIALIGDRFYLVCLSNWLVGFVGASCQWNQISMWEQMGFDQAQYLLRRMSAALVELLNDSYLV